ncbi:hypothetical protein G3I19_25440 [Streptomyces sp. SID10853]|uniref:hypothetical protein n=1 Tax=Streptomyces sp. SID10853 TaxID=2706028 RepID=UPI0013BF3C65|nr:hypothetical protein [Streptomyces sp. SID10853]NDZ81818.1 hypothetical protein [Streptomyces sp. SID10853]
MEADGAPFTKVAVGAGEDLEDVVGVGEPVVTMEVSLPQFANRLRVATGAA